MVPVIATVLTVVLLAVGGADYWFVERPHQSEDQMNQGSSSEDTMSSTSSATAVPKGVSKHQVNIDDILTGLALTPVDTQEPSLIGQVAGPSVPVQTKVLMQSNDRAALFAWVDTPDVKSLFLTLKQTLQPLFSSQVKDINDESFEPENGPPYDVLSFTDPAISPEKILFVRVRTRLYEFHIAAGQENTIQQMVSELTR